MKTSTGPITAASTELLTINDVCAWLHVSKMTIHRWRRGEGVDGFPAPIRIGGGIRFLRKDIESFIVERPSA